MALDSADGRRPRSAAQPRVKAHEATISSRRAEPTAAPRWKVCRCCGSLARRQAYLPGCVATCDTDVARWYERGPRTRRRA
jgi:hypothetical protein